MNYEFLLAIDPSGSYFEGKGTTGWCIVNCKDKCVTLVGSIYATNHESMTKYWDEHTKLIERFSKRYSSKFIVVIEDYILYESKAQGQINSHMETSKLIGVLQHYCWGHNIDFHMQLAGEVKSRWTDAILHYNGFIAKEGNNYVLPCNHKIKLHKHIRDAIRHGIHYAIFKNDDRRAKKYASK